MATALCNSGGATTAYAVQNVSSTNTNVTVTYSNNNAQTQTINAGAKKSFDGCGANNPAGFSGAATITSSAGDIIAIGKVYKPGAPSTYSTAFMGESRGSNRVALPYVRYTSDANYNAGTRQRAFLAIQNVGANTVSNVKVKYLNKNGAHFLIAQNGSDLQSVR
jgi:hypothetical protein